MKLFFQTMMSFIMEALPLEMMGFIMEALPLDGSKL